MRRRHLATVLLLLAIGWLGGPHSRAQSEETLTPDQLTEPTTEESEPIQTERRTGVNPAEPLRETLDYQRWLEMTDRERQTFVEGAVLTLTSVASRLRAELAVDGRVPPKNLSAVVKFVYENHPKLPPGDYLEEMDRIYLMAEGQNLSIMECFQQAFRRLNSR